MTFSETDDKIKNAGKTQIPEKIQIPDMHLHTTYSHDGKATMEEMVSEAKALGLTTIAITDHCDLIHLESRDCFTPIYASVAEAHRLSSSECNVLSGIEISDAILYPEEAKKVLAGASYDVILGSVHHVNFEGSFLSHRKRNLASFTEERLDAYLTAYFALEKDLLLHTPLDVLSHLTLPLRYLSMSHDVPRGNAALTNGNTPHAVSCGNAALTNGNTPHAVSCGNAALTNEMVPYDIHRFDDTLREILALLIQKKVALEVNTSSYAEYGIFLPDADILKLYRELGGELITVGSDAHVTKNIAAHFAEAKEMLLACGFSSVYYYRNHEPVAVSLLS